MKFTENYFYINWSKRDSRSKIVLEPAILRNLTSHSDDCYFYACDITRYNEKYKIKWLF